MKTISHVQSIAIIAGGLLILTSCNRDDSKTDNVLSNDEASVEVAALQLDLKFAPEVIEFEEFIDYGTLIQTDSDKPGALPEGIVITESRIEMPVFRRQPKAAEYPKAEQGTAPNP